MEIRNDAGRGLAIDVQGNNKKTTTSNSNQARLAESSDDVSTADLSISDQARMMKMVDDVIDELKQQLNPWYVPNAIEHNRALIEQFANSLAQNSAPAADEWKVQIEDWPLTNGDKENQVSQKTLRQLNHFAQTLSEDEKRTLQRLHQYASQKNLPLEHVDSVAWMFTMDKLYAQNQPDQTTPTLDGKYLNELLNRVRRDASSNSDNTALPLVESTI